MTIEILILQLDIIEPYYILVIVILGLIGNTYSFIKFRSSKFRNHSASFYLASLFLVNNFYLVSLFVVSLKHFKIDLFNTEMLVCKLTIYSTYVFAFLSVWNIVALSLERLLLVFFPFRSLNVKKKPVYMIISCFLCVFALSFYSFAIFTSELKFIENVGDRCQPKDKWFFYVQAMSILDSILTFIIPFIVVFLINLAILIRMARFKKKKDEANSFALNDVSSFVSKGPTMARPQVLTQTIEKLTAGENNMSPKQLLLQSKVRKVYNPSSTSVYYSRDGKLVHSNSECTSPGTSNTGCDRNRIQRKQVYWRMTRALLLISVSFLVLNFPIFFLQLCHFSRTDNINIRQQANNEYQLPVSKNNRLTKGMIMNDDLVHVQHRNMTAFFQENKIHSSLGAPVHQYITTLDAYNF